MDFHTKIDTLNYKHEIQQLQEENQNLKGEVKALRALLISFRKGNRI